jgi:hypothetical protein
LLGEAPYPWDYFQKLLLRLEVVGKHLRAWAGDRLLFDLDDHDGTLDGGGIGVVIEEGCLACEWVKVEGRPANEW